MLDTKFYTSTFVPCIVSDRLAYPISTILEEAQFDDD